MGPIPNQTAVCSSYLLAKRKSVCSNAVTLSVFLFFSAILQGRLANTKTQLRVGLCMCCCFFHSFICVSSLVLLFLALFFASFVFCLSFWTFIFIFSLFSEKWERNHKVKVFREVGRIWEEFGKGKNHDWHRLYEKNHNKGSSTAPGTSIKQIALDLNFIWASSTPKSRISLKYLQHRSSQCCPAFQNTRHYETNFLSPIFLLQLKTFSAYTFVFLVLVLHPCSTSQKIFRV